jgi:folate-binding protein YgfZ
MARITLYPALAARGARMGEYCGAETAAAFTDVSTEFDALRSRCAIFDLGWRAKMIATGTDRIRWMNGMLTNNIKGLPLNRGSYNFLLNAQGRIQGDMYVYNRGESLLIDTDASQSDRITETFAKYIIMDDVEIADTSEKITSIGLHGTACSALLKRCGVLAGAMQELEIRDLIWNKSSISLVRHGPDEGFELWVEPRDATTVWEQLLAAGATPIGTDALELLRVANGIPRYGQDIRERDLPQETAQDNALNFQKGCYVGQEIVERIHSRGNVHRSFIGFTFAGAAPAPGTKIQAGAKEVGEVTSVAVLPSKNGRPHMIGLGYLRREAAVSDVELHAGETRAKAVPLPFKDL